MIPNPTQQKFARLADTIFKALSLKDARGQDWKRIRIAVTPEEYVLLQQEGLATQGVAYNRIRSIVYVAEEKPFDHPILETR